MYQDHDFIKDALGQLPMIIFIKDRDGRYTYISRHWYMDHNENDQFIAYGKTDAELRRSGYNTRMSMETDKWIMENKKGMSYILDEKYKGYMAYLEITKNPMLDSEGNVTGIVGVIQDVTKKISAEYEPDNYSFIDTATGLYSRNGFFEMIKKKFGPINESHGLKALIILVSYLTDEGVEFDFPSFICLSNAIRLPITEGKVCARIDKNIFAVFLVHSSSNQSEELVSSFVSKMTYSIEESTKDICGFKNTDIITEWQSINEKNIDEVKKVTDRLQNDIIRIINGGRNKYTYYKKKFSELRKKIYENPEADRNISQIADEIGLSKSHFHRMYKKFFFTSCTDDIIDARLKKACELLENTDMHVGEISVLCGYNSESLFMRQFHSRIGVTAVKYRSRYKKI